LRRSRLSTRAAAAGTWKVSRQSGESAFAVA
jgi:hypothetical protein